MDQKINLEAQKVFGVAPANGLVDLLSKVFTDKVLGPLVADILLKWLVNNRQLLALPTEHSMMRAPELRKWLATILRRYENEIVSLMENAARQVFRRGLLILEGDG